MSGSRLCGTFTKRSSAACALLIAAWLPFTALAQQTTQGDTFRQRPLRIVAPSTPGSGIDVIARLVGAKLTETFGQQAVVDNRPGAGGIVGMQMVANAEPNGHTMIVVAPAYALNPSFYSKLPYDTFRDFTPITIVGSQPNVLIVPVALPARTVKELIALAKAKPGQLNFASSGLGTGGHLSMALFKDMAGLDIVHVPYKGGGAATSAVLVGEVQMATTAVASVLGHVKSGRLRALGVTSAKRNSELPEVPTIAEAGVPGYDMTGWYAALVPGQTPPKIVDRLYGAIAEGLKSPDFRARLVALGFEPGGMTPAQTLAYVRKEHDKWAKVIRASGMKLDLPQ